MRIDFWEGVQVKLVQAEGRDEITTLRELISQLQVAMQSHRLELHLITLDSWVTEKSKNQNNKRGSGNDQNQHGKPDCSKVKCFQCEEWAHLAQECPSTPLNKNWGRLQTPPTCPQDVQPRRGESRKSITSGKSNSEPGYHIPSPLVWLIGHLNEAMVVVEGVKTMASVNIESQIFTLTEGFCLEFGLTVLLLGVCYVLREQGGHLIPNKGYVEANLLYQV